MATTGTHGLSMFRNSCLKSPVDPKTGLTTCLTDRENSQRSRNTDSPANERDSDQENREPTSPNVVDGHFDLGPGSGRIGNSSDFLNASSTAKLIESLTLGDMSDDEFYNNLLTLKNEHKKTLEMCEKIYQDKLQTEGFMSSSSSVEVGGVAPGPAPTLENMGRDYGLSNVQPVNTNTSGDTFNKSLEMTSLRKSTEKPPPAPKDRVRDMGSKPPSVMLDLQQRGRQVLPGRIGVKSAWTENANRTGGDDYWKQISDSSGDEMSDYDKNRYTELARQKNHTVNGYGGHPEELAAAMTRIDDMWDHFSVEEYAPRRAERSSRPRSSSAQRKRSVERRSRERPAPVEVEDSWRHRITIPKPFGMTVREENKQKTKSRTLAEYEEGKLKEMQEEDAECQKTFKATPVPAHVYLPLYDEINERAETRRRVNQQLSKEVLKSMERPFKFLKREQKQTHNCHQRANSAPQKKSRPFKAKPIPKEVYDSTVSDRLREEEEYRKIRIKMRSQELRSASSLPPNMAARGSDYVAGRIKSKIDEKAAKYGITSGPQFQPKIKENVPDFEKIHRKLQKEMMNQKERKEATVCKPFNLRTNAISRDVDKVVHDMMKDELVLKENRWPYQNPRARPRSGSLGSLTQSFDNIPSKLTTSQELRSSANRDRIAELTRREQALEEKKKRQREKEKQLKKVIADKGMGGTTQKESPAEKLRKYREAERARREEYESELMAMKERVESRPYLFERQSQINARKQAEKRYSATLRNAGVSEDFIHRKGSEATEQYLDDDGDDYDEDFNSYSLKSASRQDSHQESRKGNVLVVNDDEGASDDVEEDFEDDYDYED